MSSRPAEPFMTTPLPRTTVQHLPRVEDVQPADTQALLFTFSNPAAGRPPGYTTDSPSMLRPLPPVGSKRPSRRKTRRHYR
jgi:hypothetical protein